MILYHGTDSISADRILKEGILLDVGSKYVDNGQGFYTATERDFALERAKMVVQNKISFTSKSSLKPVVLSFKFNDIVLNSGKLSIRIFDSVSVEWKEFVLLNRLGHRFLTKKNINSSNHNLDLKFDIVYNYTADAGITEIVSKIKRQESDYRDFLTRIDISTKKVWGKQISFHTQNSLRYLSLIK